MRKVILYFFVRFFMPNQLLLMNNFHRITLKRDINEKLITST